MASIVFDDHDPIQLLLQVKMSELDYRYLCILADEHGKSVYDEADYLIQLGLGLSRYCRGD